MIAVIQRVTEATVCIDERAKGQIQTDFLVLIGISYTDNASYARCHAKIVILFLQYTCKIVQLFSWKGHLRRFEALPEPSQITVLMG